MIVEMHSHTAERSPCSHVSAVEVVRWMVAKGLQGIVLTDHHYLWTAHEIAELRRSAGLPRHFVVLAGQETEVERFGHVLVYGAGETLEQGTTVEAIRARFPEAAVVWAHPYRNGGRPSDEDLTSPLFDAVEIFSSNHSVAEAYRGLEDWHRLRFTAISGTDTHARSYGGAYPTMFDHPVGSIEELVRELKAGRCRPFFKEIPKSGTTRTEITEITFGTKGDDEARQRLIVKRHADDGSWRRGERTFRVMETLAARGFADGRYRIPEPLARDEGKRALIERGIRGRTLFDRVVLGDAATARMSVDLAARWLARLHNLRLAVTPAAEFFDGERERLARYVQGLVKTGHPRAERVREAADRVLDEELARFEGREELLVQGHGDYHPKNIIVGQDRADDRDTVFVAAIDFASSHRMPRAFDVGTFLAQFGNQLSGNEGAAGKVGEGLFLESYRDESDELPSGFDAAVELYRARCGLSILYYLNKVGLGESEDFWRVLVEAEQALAGLAASGA